MSDLYPDINRNVTALQMIDCPCCGRPNPLRMNNSDRCFYTCKWPTGDDGQPCRAERRYTNTETAALVRTFNENNLKMKGRDNGKDTTGPYDFYK